MSLRSPTICCMLGRFEGSSAVHRYPILRASSISRSSPVSRIFGSIALDPWLILTSPLTQLTKVEFFSSG
ncbi:hypothetical protein OIU77_030810 [Salix suchowensis]|uniref:Uncharacterized protein n=1 Tax=Salix suchowensis TaxID=1278906 RepID=A0ABQ9BDQ2_9ROSI|nr:hypothetical protein OIU77_030810 [Salix suchowensis]